MAKKPTREEKQELMDILKFTPITVQVMIQGYGGESYAGTVDRKIYEYFKEHKIDLDEFANDWDDEHFKWVPDEMRPFSQGQQYECDNKWHASGAELDGLNTITVSGPDGDIWEHNMDYSELEEAGVTVEEYGGCDLDDDDIPEGYVIYNGAQGEKGCFFDGELLLRAPFDPKKLKISYENCGGWYIVNYVEYDGEEIDGSGGYSTTGKWGENKWILPGDEEVYEPVSIEDREGANEFPTDEEINELDELSKSDFDYECVQCTWKGTVDELAYTNEVGVCPECGEPVESINKDTFDWSPLPEMPEAPKTDWFPKDVNPVRKGTYEVVYDAEWPNSGMGMAEWTGRSWKQNGKKLAIKQWRGLSINPEEV